MHKGIDLVFKLAVVGLLCLISFYLYALVGLVADISYSSLTTSIAVQQHELKAGNKIPEKK